MHCPFTGTGWGTVLALWVVGAVTPSFGAVHVVASLQDSGAGSFREALIRANELQGPDTIRVSAEGVIALASALPPVTDDLEILGPGSDRLRLSGSGLVSVMSFVAGRTYRMAGLTVADGLAVGGWHGAGISNAGSLTLVSCAVVGNTNQGGWGGGMYNQGDIRLESCVVSSNAVFGSPGESGEIAGGGGGGGLGGGLFGAAGTVWILDSVLEGNRAQGGSGGRAGTGRTRGGAGGGPLGGAGGQGVEGQGQPGGLGSGGGGGSPLTTRPEVETEGQGGLGGLGGGGGGGGLARFPWNPGGGSLFGGGVGSTGDPSGAGGGGGGAGMGGAVFLNQGSATLERCRLARNVCIGGAGGVAGTGGQGGGGLGGGLFANEAEVWVRECWIDANRVEGGPSEGVYGGGLGGLAAGGGFLVRQSMATIVASTFSSNAGHAGPSSAGSRLPMLEVEQGVGGAIAQWGGMIAMTNCTVAHNLAQGGRGASSNFHGHEGGEGRGGGYYGAEGACRILHGTFVGNRAQGGRPGFFETTVGAPPVSPGRAFGGGFWFGTGTTNEIVNSLFVGNVATQNDEVPSDGFGGVVSLGINLLGTATQVTGLQPTDLVGAKAKWRPLANRGGSTPTIALRPESAAIHAAAARWAPGFDQRGTARPLGSGPDIGAYESSWESASTPAILVNGTPQSGESATHVGPARISFTAGDESSVILYSLDGSPPHAGSMGYGGPFVVTNGVQIRVVAYDPEFSTPSAVASLDLTLLPDTRVHLATQVVGGGVIRVTPSVGPFKAGTIVRVTAIPADGWRFSQWKGDASGANVEIELRMDQDVSVVAEFVPVATYPLTVEKKVNRLFGGRDAGPGTVDLDPPGSVYVSNTLVTVTARVPRIRFSTGDTSFSRWSAAGMADDTRATIVVRMDRPRALTAVFDFFQWSPPRYWLHLEARGGGRILETTPNSSAIYPAGWSAGLRATPDDGWTFLGWTGDSDSGSVTNVIVMDQDKYVVAVFGTSMRRVIAGEGSIEAIPDRSLYPAKSTVRLQARPGPGYRFARWGSAVAGTANPASLVIQEAEPTVSALFVPLSPGHAALELGTEGDGTVTSSPTAEEYPIGTLVQLTAVPGPGQDFLGWFDNVTGTNPVRTVAVQPGVAVVARFTRRPRVDWVRAFDYPGMESLRVRLTGADDGVYNLERAARLGLWTRTSTARSLAGEAVFLPLGASTTPTTFYRAARAGAVAGTGGASVP